MVVANSGVTPEVERAFAAARAKAGSAIGSPTTGIVATADGKGFKQDFSGAQGAGSGILIMKRGGSEAFWVHGGIFQKYKAIGGSKWAYPISSELPGFTSPLSGKRSVYQKFLNATVQPNLQWVDRDGRAYLIQGGIRDFWWENRSRLGVPAGDELASPPRQEFEGGTVYWNSGRPSIGQAAGPFTPPLLGGRGYRTPLNTLPTGHCTWYCFGRTYELTGRVLKFLGGSRHGGNWPGLLPDLPRGNDPRPRSVASWSKGEYGHVAFVESVKGDLVYFTEANWNRSSTGIPGGGYDGYEKHMDVRSFRARYGRFNCFLYLS